MIKKRPGKLFCTILLGVLVMGREVGVWVLVLLELVGVKPRVFVGEMGAVSLPICPVSSAKSSKCEENPVKKSLLIVGGGSEKKYCEILRKEC